MIKKNIYKWHRTLSLIIAIPVTLWALSGFFHPIMTNIRPKVATQSLVAKPIDSSRISITLKEALQLNKIDSFTNFRFVSIDTNWFYQIQKGIGTEPVYLSTRNGKLLKKGDWLYAQYIAKLFLEGQGIDSGTNKSITDSTTVADCCDAATVCVMKNQKGAKIISATAVTDFDEEYKNINRILPVYKVLFDRKDGIRIYVETIQDRFTFAIDDRRAIFNKIFVLVHTWGWLDFLGNGRLIIEIGLTLLAFLTTIFGIYIFFSTRSKKVKGNKLVSARRGHRFTSICIAVTTLMFSFSGAYHAFSKFAEDHRDHFFDEHWFISNDADLDLNKIKTASKKQITNISLVSINGTNYWQVYTKRNSGMVKTENKSKDLMKGGFSSIHSAIYLAGKDLTKLGGGDTAYAHYLANLFGNHTENEVQKTETITKFAGEYGFANKRLPVYKVSYGSNYNERFYVETSTGRLSVRIDDLDMLEGYSFAFLHKHEFLTPIGKGYKDFSTMFWAAAQIALVIVGLVLYVRVRKKK